MTRGVLLATASIRRRCQIYHSISTKADRRRVPSLYCPDVIYVSHSIRMMAKAGGSAVRKSVHWRCPAEERHRLRRCVYADKICCHRLCRARHEDTISYDCRPLVLLRSSFHHAATNAMPLGTIEAFMPVARCRDQSRLHGETR